MATALEDPPASPAPSRPPAARRRLGDSARSHLIAAVSMLVAAVYSTWPLVKVLPDHAPQNLGDPLLSAWMYGWGERTFFRNPVHLFNANIFSPERFTFAMSENLLGQSVPLTPLTWITGNSLLTLNIGLILYLALGGFGMYLLVRQLTGRTAGPVIAGVAFAAAPYRLAQIGHPHVLGTYLTPFILLMLVRLGDDAARPPVVRRRVITLALLIALQYWTSLTGGTISLIGVGAWVLWTLAARGRHSIVPLRRAAAGVAIGGLLVIPLLVPYMEVRRLHPDYVHGTTEVYYYSASPTSYFSPAEGGPIADRLYHRLQRRFPVSGGFWEKQLFPGVVPLTGAALLAALVVAGWVRRGRLPVLRPGADPSGPGPGSRAGPGLALSLIAVGYVFSLGPRLNGKPDGLVLPFALIENVFSGLMRVPGRIGLLVAIGVCMATGVALSRLPRRAAHAAVALCVVILALEMYPSRFPIVEAPKRDAALAAVAKRPGVVLSLPTSELDANGIATEPSIVREAQHMWLSTKHFRPMINGFMAYYPPSYWEVVRGVQDFPAQSAFDLFKRRDIKTLVIRTDMLPDSRWRDVVPKLEQWPGVRLVAASGQTRVYDLTAVPTTPAP